MTPHIPRQPAPSQGLKNQFTVLQSSLVNASVAIQRLTGLIGEQRTRLQAVMATLPEGILMMDSQGHVLLENGLASAFLEEMTPLFTGEGSDIPQRLRRQLQAQGLSCLTQDVPAKGQSYKMTMKRFHPESPVERYTLYIRKEATVQAPAPSRRTLERFMMDLIAALAHEVNNPLTPILALSSPGMRTGDVGDETLETIFAAGERIAGLVGQMLILENVLRSDSTQSVDVERLFLDLIQERKRQGTRSTITLHCSVTAPVSRTGESGIRQLLLFLMTSLDNARSHTPHHVELLIDEDENGIVIRIRDAGLWPEKGMETPASRDTFADFYALLAETLASHLRLRLTTLHSEDGKTGYALRLPLE